MRLQHDWGEHWNRPDHDSGQKSVCASRHLYENIARGFVLKISNIAVKTAAAVKTLKFDAASARVTGIYRCLICASMPSKQ